MKRMKKILLALLVMALLLITACGSGEVADEDVTAEDVHTKVVETVKEIAESVNLEEAQVIVSGGRGMGGTLADRRGFSGHGSGRDQPQAHPQCIHDAGNAAL